jgi:hypothetical protein
MWNKNKIFVAGIIALFCIGLFGSILSQSNLIRLSPTPEKMSQITSMERRMDQNTKYKKLLFFDQSLEELMTQYTSQDFLLSDSYQYLRNGNLAAAKSSLAKISVDPTAEIRHQLWVWKALRQLGEIPADNIRDEVRGVIFEIPINGWVDTLAAYSDGRVRYLNGKLGVIPI